MKIAMTVGHALFEGVERILDDWDVIYVMDDDAMAINNVIYDTNAIDMNSGDAIATDDKF